MYHIAEFIVKEKNKRLIMVTSSKNLQKMLTRILNRHFCITDILVNDFNGAQTSQTKTKINNISV